MYKTEIFPKLLIQVPDQDNLTSEEHYALLCAIEIELNEKMGNVFVQIDDTKIKSIVGLRFHF